MLTALENFAAGNVFLAGVLALLLLGALALLARGVWRLILAAAAAAGRGFATAGRAVHRKDGERFPAEDVLTVIAASLATSVSLNGMWRFAGTVLHFTGPERVLLFSFIEVSMVTCALRARRNIHRAAKRMNEEGGQHETPSAGVDGAAVWVLSALSGFFAALNAASATEGLFRLAPPLLAAWMWERSLAVQRRAATGKRVSSKVTAERILVWLRLAEPTGRTTTEVDTHRRIAALARADHRLGVLRRRPARPAFIRRAERRRNKLLAAALDHTGLATDPAVKELLRHHILSLSRADTLGTITGLAPWEVPADEKAGDSDQENDEKAVGGGGEDEKKKPNRDRKPIPPSSGRGITAQELAEAYRDEVGPIPVPSVNRVVDFARKRGTGVSRDKARDAQQILEADRMQVAK